MAWDMWIVAVVILAAWWYAVYTLDRIGFLKKHNMTAIGPLLMWRSYRGLWMLDRFAAPKRFWKILITLGIPLIAISMVFMLLMIIFVDILMIVQTPAPGPANEPQNILAIPGLNEYIPFLWGWIALIVAMLAHELGHAIMARAENIKVGSMGLLLLGVPIGAFAELNEEEMFGTKSEGKAGEILGPMDTAPPDSGKRKAGSLQLVRILGAGVISNFIVAFIVFALLFGPVLGAIAGDDCNTVVIKVAGGSPADLAGIKSNFIINQVDGKDVSSPSQINDIIKSRHGSNVTIAGMQGSKQVSYTVPVGDARGVYILGVIDGYPGKEAGLKPNMRLLGIDGTMLDNADAYTSYMANTTAGQNVTLTVLDTDGTQKNLNLTLAAGTEKKGYIGFTGADLSDNPLGMFIGRFNAQGHLDWLKALPLPQGDGIVAGIMTMLAGWFVVLLLPLWEFTGDVRGVGIFQSDLSSLFHPVGWAAPFGNGIFYLAICLFWIGWLNFNVALFNCLPMIPLDGGHIFRELARTVIGKFVKDREKVERISKSIVNGLAITLFASLLFMFFAPYIVQWLGGL